jgi:hypothetical protein
MRRTPLCEQSLQSSLLERLVGADRNAIAPATNLLHGEPMTRGRVAHLNLEFDRFSDHLNRMPNAGRAGEADPARPERHGPSAYHIRFIFAYYHARWPSRLVASGARVAG